MTSTHAPRTITARNPDDLVAAVPVLMGFTPEDSIVMLTLGPGAPFHARVDLPHRARDRKEITAMLLKPVLDHHVSSVAFVFYSKTPKAVRPLARMVIDRFRRNGVDVVDALHANGSHWFPALPEAGASCFGVPYDSSTHPIAVQAVVDGHVTFSSRSALAASLVGDPAAIADVEAALLDLPTANSAQQGDERGWVRTAIQTALQGGETLGDACCARLLRGLIDLEVRDDVWMDMTRENASGQVTFWTDLLRRTPTDLIAAPASLLAFAAWLSGHGALAWCALDRCREGEPDYPMADLLAHLLDGAVPPSAW